MMPVAKKEQLALKVLPTHTDASQAMGFHHRQIDEDVICFDRFG